MKKRYLIIIISLLLITTAGISAIGYFILCQFDSLSVAELEQLIMNKVGYNTTIAKVKPRWVGLNLVLRLEQVALHTRETDLPILQADAIEGKLNILQTIINMTPRVSKITFVKPKVIFTVGAHKTFDFDNIGEYLSSSIDLTTSLPLLREVKTLNIIDGNFTIQVANYKDLVFTSLNLQFCNIGTNNYKLQSVSNIASMEQAMLTIDGTFFGKFTQLDEVKASLNIRGTNLDFTPYLKLFPLALDIQQLTSKDLNFSLAWHEGKLVKAKGAWLVNSMLTAGNTNVIEAKAITEYIAAEDAVMMNINNLSYSNTTVFPEPIHVLSAKGKITWHEQYNNVLFALENIDVVLPDVRIKADVGASYQAGKFNNITLHGVTDAIDVDKARKYIPVKILPAKLSTWLLQAIRNGSILSNSLVFREGKFDWLMHFKDVNLQYDPDWPALLGLSGNLHLTEKQIKILGISGKIVDIPIGITTASVDGLNNEQDLSLVVDGEVPTTLAEGVKFLLASPLKAIGKVLANYKPQGNMHLDLKLNIPLADNEDTSKVDAKLQIKNGVLTDTNLGTDFKEIEGTIDVTEKTIVADHLTVKFLGQESIAVVNYNENKSNFLNIALTAAVNEQKLINLCPLLANAKLQGQAAFAININVPVDGKGQKHILLTSDLLGLGIDLPYPFNKLAEEKAQFSIQLPNNNLAKIIISYGENINGTFILAQNKLKEGVLIFGEDNSKTNIEVPNVLLLQGKLPKCDLYAWLQSITQNNYVVNIPINLALLIDKLNILDNQFNSVSLYYNTNEKEIVFKGDDVTGVLKFATDVLPTTLDFNKIVINNLEQLQAKTKIFSPTELLTVRFKCDDLIFNNNKLGAVKFNLIPKEDGYEIADLSVSNANFELAGQGKWNMLGKQTTNLSGKINSNNIGDLLYSWEFGKSINKGSGEVSVVFDWQGKPGDAKLSNLIGNIDLNIISGQIQGIDPGFGRIIGLLSLDSIQRRLKLDFSDLFGNGFAFDKLRAVCKINNGIFNSEGIFIDGPSAYIALSGEANMLTRQINFKMGVVPKVGASLPLAAAITAGNPAIGAVFWILGKATSAKSKDRSNETPKYRYHVTGTWEQPVINEIKEQISSNN